ncbi:hypothetical protein, partial [Escherichia coli]|uniref:hypothetical protein n=1 Tax=Escherichia coli TaxID=562 RepID=UPI001A8CAC15
MLRWHLLSAFLRATPETLHGHQQGNRSHLGGTAFEPNAPGRRHSQSSVAPDFIHAARTFPG